MNSNGNRRLPHNIQKKGKSKQEIRRKKRRSSDPIVDYIMNLQRTVGNKRVEELIKSGTIQPDSISREIYAVQKKEAVSASESFIRTKMPDVWNGLLDARAQAKLKVGSSNDIFEQEADRVAESVVNMSDADVRRKNDSVEVRAKGNFNSSFTADSAVESGIRSMKGGGNTLSSPVRRFYEARFNRDFGGVRIHTGNKADFLNRSINARAFTTGKDIFFAKGEFSPGSRSGKVLLAHELTHVVQQNKGLRAKRPVLEKYRISRKPVSADVKLSAGTMISRKYEQPKNSKYLHNYIRPIPQIVKDLYERDYTFSVKELNHWACGHFVQVFDANGDRVFKKYIKGNPNFRLTRDVVKKGKAGGKKKNWIVSVEVTKTMAFWGTKKAKYFPHTYTRFYVFDTHKEQTKTLKPVKKQYGSYHWVQKKVYADADERKAVIIMNPSAATIYVGNEVQYGIPRLTRSKSQTTLAVENMLGWNAENRFLINTSGFAFDPSMCRWEIYYDKRSYRKYRKKGRKLSRRLSYGYRDRIKFSPEIPGNHLIRLTIYNHRTRK
ncbi:MAG: DUF4157 domain-containing protein, partial [bacterium]|nr:DUF4157 domain-containing protein [bacterium]